MEAPDLSSPAYWESDEVDLRLNPKRLVDVSGLLEFLEGEHGLRSSIVLATSGSSGTAKFVILPKAAILASARAVNKHCGLTSDDVWLGGLSTFHVGGIGIYARAYDNGAKVVPMAWDSWTRDGTGFLKAVSETRATVSSLTPVHLWDLVRAEASCPETLRGVFLGGGRIDPALVGEARGLGWPVWPTYGMSEAGSQVATSLGGDGTWLELLPHWEARTEARDGRLEIRGPALFSVFVRREGADWRLDPAKDGEGWFATGDRCELHKGSLRFVERMDDAVKVLGELVSLSSLNARLSTVSIHGLIVARPDPRRGHELVLVREPGGGSLEQFNEGLSTVEQVAREHFVPELPRTELGKVDRAKVEEIAG